MSCEFERDWAALSLAKDVRSSSCERRGRKSACCVCVDKRQSPLGLRARGHALHAAGDHEVSLAGLNVLSCQHDGLHAGRADLIECHARSNV